MSMLRDFEDGDYEGLAALWSASGVGNPARGDGIESIHRSLESRARLLVLAEGELIIGSVWLTDDGRRLYVHHMALLPDEQGKGQGGLLMKAAVEIARERGLQMKLEVHRDNARAIALYRKFGFDFIGAYELMINRSTGR